MSIKAFFAYPNHPRISEAINEFSRKINNAALLQIETWEEMQIGGKLLVTEICKKIDQSDLFCADITKLNPNVLFEIGYAIARKKRIWLIRDTTIPAENSDFKQFKVLTTLGFREYISSVDIIHSFYRDLPHESLEETVYDQAIEPFIHVFREDHVLYLKAFYEDEASVKVTQFLGSNSRSNKYKLLIDDPRETDIQPLSWYAKNVHSASAVICHLTTLERENSKIQNAKHSLVAGLAHGFGIPMLLLIEGDLFGPTDYRDLLFFYSKSKSALTRVEQFINPISQATANDRTRQIVKKAQNRKIDELAGLSIGEPIAEHEEDSLTEDAFIETAAYHAAIQGSQTTFVGRKGVGKTANFKKLSRVFSSDKRNVVCEIKPLSYELEALLLVARRFELLSKKGFLFESLWKFLIYSELAKFVVQDIEMRPSGEVFDNETELVNLMDERADLLNLDFSARLDTLSSDLLASTIEDSPSHQSAVAVSELLHSGIIKQLLHSLSEALQKKERVIVLIDNLDKAWDKSENSRFLCYFFLGLLSALRRVTNDFKNQPDPRKQLKVSLCVFVRADIFEMVVEQAREPDKIRFQRITWDDRQRLQILADSRLMAAVGATDQDFDAARLWQRFFTQSVYDQTIFDYIFSIILYRPRDLLFFLGAAISSAVNRRHDTVKEDDFVKAEEDYSGFAYQSMLVELREKIPHIEDILTEFMGGNSILSELDIRKKIILQPDRNDVDFERVISSLAQSSFLQIDVPTKGFAFANDEKEFSRLYRAALNSSESSNRPIRFRIHRAFWHSLLIQGPT